MPLYRRAILHTALFVLGLFILGIIPRTACARDLSVVSSYGILPVDFNGDTLADTYRAEIAENGKSVAVVTLSNGVSLCLPLDLPTLGRGIPSDVDGDGDLDIVFFDAASLWMQTIWNDQDHGFRVGAVKRILFTRRYQPDVAGSGVDPASLTSPPQRQDGLVIVWQYRAAASPLRVCVSHLPRLTATTPALRLLACSLTRRGPPTLSSL